MSEIYEKYSKTYRKYDEIVDNIIQNQLKTPNYLNIFLWFGVIVPLIMIMFEKNPGIVKGWLLVLCPVFSGLLLGYFYVW